jgi:hypothetical protein
VRSAPSTTSGNAAAATFATKLRSPTASASDSGSSCTLTPSIASGSRASSEVSCTTPVEPDARLGCGDVALSPGPAVGDASAGEPGAGGDPGTDGPEVPQPATAAKRRRTEVARTTGLTRAPAA